MIARHLAAVTLSMLLVGPARAADVASQTAGLLQSLWADRSGPAPATVALLLWEMSQDPGVEAAVLARAGSDHRRLMHQVLSTLAWTEPEALEVLEGLHVVRSTSPPPDRRPPAWADVRWVGLRLLRAIAPVEDGRDVRRERDLDRALQAMPYRRPSEVAGLVLLWQAWWADRGDDPSLYLEGEPVPSADAWWGEFTAQSDSASVLELLPRLHDDALRRRLFLARLDPDVHAYVVAECIELLKLYQPEFVERGVPERRWNPDRGRMEGYQATDLRELAMQFLDRITGRLASGADEDARITDWLTWWRAARMQARYYRDPLSSPTFETWLGGLDQPVEAGGKPMVRFLREFYVAEGLQVLLLERLGSAQEQIVAELMQWLRKDHDAARVDGFEFVHRRWPIRPRYRETGELMAIPWPQVQKLIRAMLAAITGVEGLPEEDLPQDRLDGFWFDWWRYHEDEARWYRGEPPAASARPRFEPERARSG